MHRIDSVHTRPDKNEELKKLELGMKDGLRPYLILLKCGEAATDIPHFSFLIPH
jgi:hypothetical protein